MHAGTALPRTARMSEQAARRIAIVGAGWSGLAAAVELTRCGHAVDVFEAAAEPGGRARRLRIGDHLLDNGQHLFLGACRDTLAVMAQVGVEPRNAFLRQPLTLHLEGPNTRLHLRMPPGPPRLALTIALLRARGVSFTDRLRALGQGRHLLTPPVTDTDVASWLAQAGQPPSLRERLWTPLCLAALNQPPSSASARVFAGMLAETFSGAGGPDLLLPRHDLGTLFPEPAVRWLRERGRTVRCGTRVRSLVPTNGRWQLATADGTHEADAVVLATAPAATKQLLPDDPACRSVATELEALGGAPITTLWLQYPPTSRLPEPMIGRLDGPAQWLFDRRLTGQPGLIAAVISGDGPHMDMDREQLTETVARQLTGVIAERARPEILGMIREKRATHCTTPGSEERRIGMHGPLPGLWFAGDHVANGLAATIEGAVRNGLRCARAIDSQPDPGESP